MSLTPLHKKLTPKRDNLPAVYARSSSSAPGQSIAPDSIYVCMCVYESHSVIVESVAMQDKKKKKKKKKKKTRSGGLVAALAFDGWNPSE